MFAIFTASVVTLGSFICDLFFNRKKKPSYYIVMFMLISVLSGILRYTPLFGEESFCFTGQFPITERFLNLSQSYESVLEWNNNHNPIVIKTLPHKKWMIDIKKEFIEKCREKIDYHYDEGAKCFREAEEACAYFPVVSDQEKARMLFMNFLATMAPTSPREKIVGGLMAAIGQYGCLAMSEWQRIDTKLHEAQHHFDMEAFYFVVASS